MRKPQIAVIGSAGIEEYPYNKPDQTMLVVAKEIGECLAKNKCVVVNGGKGGVMEAVCKGAKKYNGVTIAEVAGNKRGVTNQYVDIEVVTADIGFRGPSQLIGMSDAVISIGGGAGTLQELAVAYRMEKPVILLVGYGGWTDRVARLDYLDERKLVKFLPISGAKEVIPTLSNLLQLEEV